MYQVQCAATQSITCYWLSFFISYNNNTGVDGIHWSVTYCGSMIVIPTSTSDRLLVSITTKSTFLTLIAPISAVTTIINCFVYCCFIKSQNELKF